MNESQKGKHIAFLKFAATSSKKIETEWKTFFKGSLFFFVVSLFFCLSFFKEKDQREHVILLVGLWIKKN